MTNQETAIKFGVPLPKTCEALNWQEETIFSWLFTKKDNKAQTLLISIDRRYRDESLYSIVPAPQMHEIAYCLPSCFHYKRENDKQSFCYALMHTLDFVGYYSDALGDRVSVFELDVKIPCGNGNKPMQNYAEAYAMLYLKLREANIIK